MSPKFLMEIFLFTHHSLLDLVVDRDCTGSRRTVKMGKKSGKLIKKCSVLKMKIWKISGSYGMWKFFFCITKQLHFINLFYLWMTSLRFFHSHHTNSSTSNVNRFEFFVLLLFRFFRFRKSQTKISFYFISNVNQTDKLQFFNIFIFSSLFLFFANFSRSSFFDKYF